MSNSTQKFLQENIKKYSKLCSYSDYANDDYLHEFTKEEKFVITYIQNMVPAICNKYLQKKISAKEVAEKANYIVFDRYNQSTLDKLLKREVIDFLIILGELSDTE